MKENKISTFSDNARNVNKVEMYTNYGVSRNVYGIYCCFRDGTQTGKNFIRKKCLNDFEEQFLVTRINC